MTYYCICMDILRVLIALVAPETFRQDIMSTISPVGEGRRWELVSPFDTEEKNVHREDKQLPPPRVTQRTKGRTEGRLLVPPPFQFNFIPLPLPAISKVNTSEVPNDYTLLLFKWGQKMHRISSVLSS